jgi:hypothetical protein
VCLSYYIKKWFAHWTDEIVAMLLSQSTDYNSKGNFLHSLLEFEEIETLNAAKGQRLLHSHLPIRFFPTQHIEKRCKIVYVNRNPKDRHVSMFNWLLGKVGIPENWTLFSGKKRSTKSCYLIKHVC